MGSGSIVRRPPLIGSLTRLLACLLLAPSLHAAVTASRWRPALPLEYSIRHWSGKDQLPLRSVEAILQTRDGFLWFGMNNGLGRFDGAGIKVYDPLNTPALGVSPITALAEDPEGNLWIGTTGGGLVRRDRNGFRHFGPADGLDNEQIKAIHFDRQGRFWVGTDGGGLFLREPNQSRFHAFTPPGGLPEPHIIAITDDAQGQLFVTTFREGPFRLVGDRFQAVPMEPDARKNPGFTLTRSPQGRVWLGCSSGVYRFETNAFKLWSPSTQLTGHDPVVAWEIDEHEVWIGTAQGLVQWRDGLWSSYPIGGGSSARLARAMVRDHEGNIWKSSEGSGMVQLRRSKFVTLGVKEGLLDDEITAVAPTRDGSVWVGTTRGLHRLRDNGFETFGTDQGLPDAFVFSIAEDRSGRLWIATRLGGLATWETNQFRPLPPSETLPVRGAWCLTPTRDGSVWAGTTQGAYRYHDRKRIEHVQGPQALPNDDVRVIAEDAEGSIWFGTSFGLARRQGDRYESFTEPPGLPSLDIVIALHPEPDGSLWIGTLTRGLYYYRHGRFHRVTAAQGLSADGIVSIVPEGNHHLWLGTTRGVHRVQHASLVAAALEPTLSVQTQHYGRREGLRSEECAGTIQPTAGFDRTGRFWIATSDGLATLHPDRIPSNPSPPIPHIERIALEGPAEVPHIQGRDPATTRSPMVQINARNEPGDQAPPGAPRRSVFEIAGLREVWIPPGQDRIEFHYCGLAYTTPEAVGFMCQLEGYDRDWVLPGERRVAFYTRVPPGDYVFRMRAFNEDGISSQPLAIAVHIAPTWWQIPWVRTTAAALLLAALSSVAAHQWRSLEKRRRAASELSRHLIRSQENERCRIAGELHDGVGQELQLIRNRSELALQRLRPAPDLASELHAISHTAARAIQGVRHLSRGLRPPELDQLGLTQALRWLVTQTAAATTSKLDSRIDPIDGILPKELELDFYRIAQEGLNNAVKHAQAAEITLEVNASNQGLELSLFDNGRGFVPDSIPTDADHGSGLKTMRERAAMLGGSLEIRSEPNVGSRLTLHIPHSPRLHPNP